MFVADKKKLNWDVPREFAERFDELVTGRWGGKGKWVGAAAAMLMYLDADEKTRETYGNLALTMRGTVLPQEIRDRLTAEHPPLTEAEADAILDEVEDEGRAAASRSKRRRA